MSGEDNESCAITISNLYILRSHCAHACYTKHKAYCVQDIRLAGSIETRDGIKSFVPAADDGTDSIGLETINHQFYNPHNDGVDEKRQIIAEMKVRRLK